MIILDSSAWLEYFAGTKNGEIFAEFAENFETLVVPAICLYEVFKIIHNQRDAASATIATDFMKNGIVVEINSDLCIKAAKISLEHKLPMADSLIYATSKIYDAKILTQDADFKGLENVLYYEKNIG